MLHTGLTALTVGHRRAIVAIVCAEGGCLGGQQLSQLGGGGAWEGMLLRLRGEEHVT